MLPGKTHKLIRPIAWLLGTWKSVSGVVSYPTMKSPMEYNETLCFSCWGQPMLNYVSITWNTKDKTPMHLEAGFVRIDNNGRDVSLLTSQTFGIATIEEGKVRGSTMSVATKNISAIGTTQFSGNIVTGIVRHYSLNEKGQLVYKMKLATQEFPLTHHLHVIYEKTKDRDCSLS